MRLRDVRPYVGLVAFVLIAGGAVAVVMYVAHLRDRVRQLGLDKTNLAAAADVSRVVPISSGDSARILGDSLAAVTLLARQERQRADALDKALGLERQAKVALETRIDSLRVNQVASVAPVATDTNGARSATWHIRREPYTADVTVTLPPAGAGILDSLAVAIDPAGITVRVGCERANADGIRPARVTATGPRWLALTVTGASQDPDVCQGAAARVSWWRAFKPQLAVTLGYGVARRADGALIIAPTLSGGVTLWHIPR